MFFGMLVEPAKRKKLIDEMVAKGIDIRICWRPAHRQPYHSSLFPNAKFPNSELLSEAMLCPPLGNSMSLEDAHYVVETVNNIWEKIK